MAKRKPTPGSTREVTSFLAKVKREREALHRSEGRAPGSDWRVQDCSDYRYTSKDKRYARRFDEIAVGEFLHVERCDNRCFYGTIAGAITFWWHVKRDGSIEVTDVEVLKGNAFSKETIERLIYQLKDAIDG
jgi:hypothetical protein